MREQLQAVPKNLVARTRVILAWIYGSALRQVRTFKP